MRLYCCIFTIASACAAFCCPASAQFTQGQAALLGMEMAWHAQVQSPLAGRGIVDAHMWADGSNSRSFAVVELDDKVIRVAADQRDEKTGAAIGLETAKARALAYAQRIVGDGKEVEVQEVTIPDLTLVLVTSDGLVQALNAETGELKWSTICGRSTMPCYASAVAQAGVAVAKGSNLYVLDWATGKQNLVQDLDYSTTNSIAVSLDTAFVTDINSRIQTLSLSGQRLEPYGYIMTGRVVGKPVTLENRQFAAVATESGFLYVFTGGEKPSEWIRYESSSSISGCLAAGNNAFYIGNRSGALSKISLEDRFGKILWEMRTGDVNTVPPLISGATVYVASEAGDLFSINDQDGLANWSMLSANVRQPLAVAADLLFCLSYNDEILAFDTQTGRQVVRSGTMRGAKPIVNSLTDRVYAVNALGQLRCYRQIGKELPTLTVPIEISQDDAAQGAQAANAAVASDATSPFGATDSGFGNGNAGGDPFGTVDTGTGDPFGNSTGGAGTEDPFGGSGDPFGGNSGSDPFGNGADPLGGAGSTGGGSGGSDPFGDSPF